MTEEVVTLETLHKALARCMAAHPSEGVELRLHEDANAIAGLWGLMSYERTENIQVDQIKPKVLDAYRRWAV